MKRSMHSEDISCLDISGFYLVNWLGNYAGGVSDELQDIGVDGSDFVLPIQLTLQDLPYSL